MDSLLQLLVEARRPELRRLLFSRLGVELFVPSLFLCSLGSSSVIFLCSGAGSARFGGNRGYMRADRRGQCGFANQAVLRIAARLCPYSDDVSSPEELATFIHTSKLSFDLVVQ